MRAWTKRTILPALQRGNDQMAYQDEVNRFRQHKEHRSNAARSSRRRYRAPRTACGTTADRTTDHRSLTSTRNPHSKMTGLPSTENFARQTRACKHSHRRRRSSRRRNSNGWHSGQTSSTTPTFQRFRNACHRYVTEGHARSEAQPKLFGLYDRRCLNRAVTISRYRRQMISCRRLTKRRKYGADMTADEYNADVLKMQKRGE